jgi:parvulin-like peptidyl-prolyl isomerase
VEGMKKFFIAFCLVSTTLGFAQDMAVNIAYKGMSDSITKNELKEFYTEYEELRNLPITEEIKEAIVSTIIDKKLIQLEAQRLGINYTERELISMGKAQLQFRGSDQEFKAAVAEASQLSWEEYAKRSIEQIVEQRFLQQRPEFNIYNVSVTDQEVLRHYNQDKESFKNPIAVDVSHIFLHKNRGPQHPPVKQRSQRSQGQTYQRSDHND